VGGANLWGDFEPALWTVDPTRSCENTDASRTHQKTDDYQNGAPKKLPPNERNDSGNDEYHRDNPKHSCQFSPPS
jgi:hypothetical protein